MGGYVCFPGGWAARLLGRPLLLMNADASLLLSNRALLPAARRIAFGFDGAGRGAGRREGGRHRQPGARGDRVAGRCRPSASPARSGAAAPARRRRQPRCAHRSTRRVPQALGAHRAGDAPAGRRTRPARPASTSVRAAYAARRHRRRGAAAFIDDMAAASSPPATSSSAAPARSRSASCAPPASPRCWCRSSSARPRTSATTPPGWRQHGAGDPHAAGASSRRRAWPTCSTALTREALLAMAIEGAGAGPPARRGARRRRDRGDGGDRRRGSAMKHAVKHIHFVGIGGAGMSGIAEILHNLGYRISGSDQSESATTRALAALGIRVAIGHDAAHIAGAEAVVTSSAVQVGQPRGDGGARAPRAGGRPRRDARRADAAEAGHRDRRHPRQDDDDLARHQRARRGRASTRPS